ncbi:MAG: hypothetical protein DRJ97_06645 [Thermoprotei archaeon]|nr:MAG: hypothetical protein DRJ97_06645 [Thermoprotei archaeon]
MRLRRRARVSSPTFKTLSSRTLIRLGHDEGPPKLYALCLALSTEAFYLRCQFAGSVCKVTR